MHLNPRIYKLVCSICLLLSTSALVMIARAPISGYEVSIYTSNLSPLVWVLLITSMGGSIFLLVGQALGKESQANNWWLIPLFTLMFSSLIVLLLPILKGYYNASHYDSLEHVGHIKDILFAGQFSRWNIYPALHMVPATLSMLSGLSAETVTNYIPILFSFVYVPFIYLLAKSVFQERGVIVLACVSAAILLIPHDGRVDAYSPAALMFPLALALFFRSWRRKTFNYKLLFVLMLILTPYLHPQATEMMLLTLVLTCLVQAGYYVGRKGELGREIPLTPIFILAVISFIWYVDTAIFRMGVDVWVKLVSGEVTLSPIQDTRFLLEKGGVQGFGTIWLLFKLYGGEIIYGLLAVVAAVTVARNLIHHYKQVTEVNWLVILFIAFSFLFLIYWAGMAYGVGDIFARSIYYIPIVSIMLAGLSLYTVSLRHAYKQLVIPLVICLILVSAVLSIFNKYPSPYLHHPNEQCTYMEIKGANWIINYRDSFVKVTNIGQGLYRYAIAIHGQDWYHHSPVPIDPTYPKPPVLIHDHFGYQQYKTIGESVSESSYLVLTKLDRVLYEEIWKPPIPTRWSREDFDKLEHDPTADKLYSNGEFDVWYIQHSSLTASGI